MAGKLSKSERTKAYIVEKSAPIFNTKGFHGTSLSDLIAATGLTKGSIYGNFKNKNEVAIAVFQHNVTLLENSISEYVSREKLPTKQLMAFTNYYRENWEFVFRQGGCPVLNASIEADDNLGFLKPHIQATLKNWTKGLSSIIERGKKSGEFRHEINAREMALTFIQILEGSIMMAKVLQDHSHLLLALDRMDRITQNEIAK